jgi:hypothetical protein
MEGFHWLEVNLELIFFLKMLAPENKTLLWTVGGITALMPGR